MIGDHRALSALILHIRSPTPLPRSRTSVRVHCMIRFWIPASSWQARNPRTQGKYIRLPIVPGSQRFWLPAGSWQARNSRKPEKYIILLINRVLRLFDSKSVISIVDFESQPHDATHRAIPWMWHSYLYFTINTRYVKTIKISDFE